MTWCCQRCRPESMFLEAAGCTVLYSALLVVCADIALDVVFCLSMSPLQYRVSRLTFSNKATSPLSVVFVHCCVICQVDQQWCLSGRTIRRTSSTPQNSCRSTSSVTSRPICWPTSSRKYRTRPGLCVVVIFSASLILVNSKQWICKTLLLTSCLLLSITHATNVSQWAILSGECTAKVAI